MKHKDNKFFSLKNQIEKFKFYFLCKKLKKLTKLKIKKI
jgi:hypothetical protein